MKNQKIGAWGEQQAAVFLVKKNYKIVARNSYQRIGEIDIVAWHEKEYFGKTLCFVEVKTRTSYFESAVRANNYFKQKKIMLAAKKFCRENKIDLECTPIQFEHVSVLVNRKNKTVKFEHYEVILQ